MARRSLKLAEALKDEISEVVGFELDDPRLERVTVTDVTVSEDLRDAKVFVLVQGDEKEVAEAMKALQPAMVVGPLSGMKTSSGPIWQASTYCCTR